MQGWNVLHATRGVVGLAGACDAWDNCWRGQKNWSSWTRVEMRVAEGLARGTQALTLGQAERKVRSTCGWEKQCALTQWGARFDFTRACWVGCHELHLDRPLC
ncbi:hypothetical protein L484_008253 [Morus notabilis]|uniref:Uncharacterized protein n=1 Tax=Morus notabilis TaxID=981085 RepID=W9R8Y9_9ROSA|nr:hypothetical protein L484_008253 [Morus notabilis]